MNLWILVTLLTLTCFGVAFALSEWLVRRRSAMLSHDRETS